MNFFLVWASEKRQKNPIFGIVGVRPWSTSFWHRRLSQRWLTHRKPPLDLPLQFSLSLSLSLSVALPRSLSCSSRVEEKEGRRNGKKKRRVKEEKRGGGVRVSKLQGIWCMFATWRQRKGKEDTFQLFWNVSSEGSPLVFILLCL